MRLKPKRRRRLRLEGRWQGCYEATTHEAEAEVTTYEAEATTHEAEAEAETEATTHEAEAEASEGRKKWGGGQESQDLLYKCFNTEKFWSKPKPRT